jgi:flagellar biosynthetic protein FlhB
MAGNDDDSARTEEPTPRRREDARRRGQVAVSQDVKIWAMLLASTLFVAYWLPVAGRDLIGLMLPFLDRPEAMAVDAPSAAAGMAAVVIRVLLAVAPLMAGLFAVAVLAGLIQVGPLLAPARLKPSLDKISPMKGFTRIFGAQALVEFGKGLVKVVAVAAIGVAVVAPVIRGIEPVVAGSVPDTLRLLVAASAEMLAGAAALLTLVAIADVLYQRHATTKQLRMTVQEVRDEAKQSEGDPQVKARLRRLQGERARRRMMAAVPEATVIITNPTHYAVALRYDMAAMPAPKVVAKGVDHLAQRIRAVAAAHAVPVVENPPLARSLYAAVEVDDEIPPEHYQAVAGIIGHVLRLDRRQAAAAPALPVG